MTFISQKPTTREEGYFHSGNSGLTIRITEQCTASIPEGGTVEDILFELWDHSYRYETVHGAHGESSRHSHPLTLDMVNFLLSALTNIKGRMESVQRAETAFDHNTELWRSVRYQNGFQVEEVWSSYYITSQYSNASKLLGHRYFDPETPAGERLQATFVKWTGPEVARGGGSSGGNPLYDSEDIGKTLDSPDMLLKYGQRSVIRRAKLDDPNLPVLGPESDA